MTNAEQLGPNWPWNEEWLAWQFALTVERDPKVLRHWREGGRLWQWVAGDLSTSKTPKAVLRLQEAMGFSASAEDESMGLRPRSVEEFRHALFRVAIREAAEGRNLLPPGPAARAVAIQAEEVKALKVLVRSRKDWGVSRDAIIDALNEQGYPGKEFADWALEPVIVHDEMNIDSPESSHLTTTTTTVTDDAGLAAAMSAASAVGAQPSDFGMPPDFTSIEIRGQNKQTNGFTAWDKLQHKEVTVPFNLKRGIDCSAKIIIGPADLFLDGNVIRGGNFAHSDFRNIKLACTFADPVLTGAIFNNVSMNRVFGINFRQARLNNVHFEWHAFYDMNFTSAIEAVHISFGYLNSATSSRNDVPLPRMTEGNLLDWAMTAQQGSAVTGIIPFKVLKKRAPPEHILEEIGARYSLKEPQNPFDLTFKNVGEDEVFQPSVIYPGACHSGSQLYYLAICWRLIHSDDKYGQFRGLIHFTHGVEESNSTEDSVAEDL